jgi:hypothetical protein
MTGSEMPLNHTGCKNHRGKSVPYPKLEEKDMQIPMAAEDDMEDNGKSRYMENNVEESWY